MVFEANTVFFWGKYSSSFDKFGYLGVNTVAFGANTVVSWANTLVFWSNTVVKGANTVVAVAGKKWYYGQILWYLKHIQ